ncbi:MAG TPA: hypothetical protein VIJ19_03745 [Opitutaceae bacterium]
MRKTSKAFALFLAVSLARASMSGATLVRDLGQGLTYYRVHELPADQPSPLTGRPGACVLDLRYAKSDAPSAATLKAWIKFNVTAHTPVFVLENAETDTALLAALPGGGQPGILVLAPISKSVSPDIAVHVTGAQDRKAYEALEKGADVNSLLSDDPEKLRVDEAYLEKEHIADSDAPDTVSDKPAPPRPLTDPVLQRAVQLHRGLLALKKI